jgi:AraC-like DNA-binding protein
MRYSEYAEKRSRGYQGFPIQYYYLDFQDPRYVMEMHWHEELEIIRVLSGDFELFINNERYPLHEGEVAFVGCGCLHRGIPHDCVYECVVFDVNMLCRQSNDATEKFILPIAKKQAGIKCILNSEEEDICRSVAKLIESLKNKREFYELQVYSQLFDVFASLYTCGYVSTSSTPKLSAQAKRISKLLDWIDENYTEHITLDELSEICGISKKYLCGVFKRYTSKTPINYINELRIENACYEMTLGEKNVTEAAYSNGFDDLSYFSKLFKEHKGISPSQYRKAHMQQK